MAILAPLPARDPESRARLLVAADRAVPTVLARDRLLAVAGPVGAALPAGGVRRGATIALDGPPGSGSTTVAFTLAAAATSAGEWAAVVDPDGTLGARARQLMPVLCSNGARSFAAYLEIGGPRSSRRCSTAWRWCAQPSPRGCEPAMHVV